MHFLTNRSLRTAIVKITKQGLRRVPGLTRHYLALKIVHILYKTGNFRFIYPYTPGHYYSPLPDYKEVLARSQELVDKDTAECPGINLREKEQLKLLESFSCYYSDLPFPTQPAENTRYYYENGWFGYADAITLYSILRHYEPRNIIEIGSGFSSAAMLDVNDLFFKRQARFTFIEPHPSRLFGLLTQKDKNRYTVLEQQVQDVPLEVFRTLSTNDILFIDSSHVVKLGSDVGYILFNILPELRPGVIIHFHDIFWPFEYPKEWTLVGIAWNESYFLRSFLQFNEAFEIMYLNSFIAKRHTDILREKMPLCDRELRSSPAPTEPSSLGLYTAPSSLWLKKVF